ncbi:MAG: MmcQ/YjbR family DNA-binding protein [Hyphomicrobiales bacterium]
MAEAVVMATEADLRRIAFSLPSVIEEPYYGRPSFKVVKTFMATLKEDGETLVLRMSLDERDFWLEQEPDIFFITDHYRNFPSVLVRLPVVDATRLEELLRDAWRLSAPKKVLREAGLA